MGFFTVFLAMALAVSLSWSEVQGADPIKDLTRDIEDLQAKFTDLSMEVSRLSSALKGNQVALTKLKATELSITELTNDVTELNGELGEVQTGFSALQQEYETLNGELDQYKTQLSSLDANSQANINELKERLQSLQNLLREANDEFDYELYEQQQHFTDTLESQRLEQTDAQNVLQQEFEMLKRVSETREANAVDELQQVLEDANAALADSANDDRLTGLETLVDTLQEQVELLSQQMTEHETEMQSIEQSVQTTTEDIGDLDNRLEAQQSEQVSFQGDLTGVRFNVTSLRSDTEDLEEQSLAAIAQLEDQGTRLDHQEDEQEGIQAQADQLETTFNEQSEIVEQRLTDAETRIATLETEGASAQDRITAIESTVQTLGGTVSEVDQRVDEQQTTLGTLQETVNSQASEIQSINSSLQQAVQQQEGLQQSYEDLQQEVQEQEVLTEQRLQTIESGIDAGGSGGDFTTSVAALQEVMDGLQTSLTEVNALGTSYNTEVQTTQQTLSSYATRILAVEEALSGADPDALQLQISNYEATSAQRFGTLEANIAAISTSIDAVEAQIAQMEGTAGSVSGLSGQVAQLNTQAQTNSQTLSAALASIQELRTDYQDLFDQTESFEGIVGELETNYQEVLTQLADVATTQDITDVRSRLVELGESVDTLESEVDSMHAGSTTFQTELRSDVDEITTTVQNNEVKLTELENSAPPASLSTTVAGLQETVSGLSATTSQLNTRVSSAETSVANKRSIACEGGEIYNSNVGSGTTKSNYFYFSSGFTSTPVIVPSITLVDTAHNRNNRVEIYTSSESTNGFWLTARTWGDTYSWGVKGKFIACGYV